MAWSINDEEAKLPLLQSPSDSGMSFSLSPLRPTAQEFAVVTPEQIINDLYDANPFNKDKMNEFRQAGWTPDAHKLLLCDGDCELIEEISTHTEKFS